MRNCRQCGKPITVAEESPPCSVRTRSTSTRPAIKEIREQLRLTQVQFAQVLGVHSGSLSRWETGVQAPTEYQEELIRRFARASDPEQAGFEVGRLLAREGPIPALFHLLKWGMKG